MLNHEQLLALIRDTIDHPSTPREMLQRLKIPRDQRATFKRLLTDLVGTGDLIETRGNRFGLPDRMNLVVGRITTHPRGFGFVVPDRPLDEVEGDLYIAGSNLNQAMHGDRVVARIERITSKGAEGRILRILERGASTIVGRYDVDPSGFGFVVPFDRRMIMDVQIPNGEALDAKPSDMVVVEITRWPTPTRGPLGRVREVLGDIDEPGVDNEIIIRKYGIPDEHSEDAVNEAKRLGAEVKDRDIRGRTDFRAQLTVTIDGEHARDFDDAITIDRLPGGNLRLGVHIADVAHYVPEGGALDVEAYERGTSVYFPERAVHMFPAELATGLCSLNPHVDRLVQSCVMEIDKRGTVVSYEMHDGVIHSDARMTYTDVSAILTDKAPEVIARYRRLVPLFESMRELFEILNKRRLRRGSIDFDLKEPEIVLDDEGLVEEIIGRRAEHCSPDHRGVHARRQRDRGAASRRREDADALSRPRGARSGQGGAVRGVHLDARVRPEPVGGGGHAPRFPEARRADARHAGREADRVSHAPHHAEGALRRVEPGALRAGGVELYALHVADTPLSGPRSFIARCASRDTARSPKTAGPS